jgi:hypothetical protein
MTSAADPPSWEAIARIWGGYFTFISDPENHPDEPYGAVRKDGQGPLYAATHADLLDKMKDDVAARPFIAGSVGARAGDAQ